MRRFVHLSFSFSFRSGYDRRLKGVTSIKTKIDQREPGFDFIDFIESQFGAILYSMVLFLLFFMLIFSTVMVCLLEKESHLRFFGKMQRISGFLSLLALCSPFLLPYLYLCYKEVMLENHHHNRSTRLVIAFSLTLRRAKRTLKRLGLQVENRLRAMRGMAPKELPSRYKLVV